ncbi:MULTISPECIES: NAD(P)H-dependent oxidoreductase [unclassified Paenibacillus]|uniref:NAD(P)H-dependent oxidoreductase n=1 Tax=unclassified Paenibacillus TaxID=185978 RepID=UPI00070F551F|nr:MULTISPECIES: NAD(P)H-dependent oxidoreductase [unclassified Paenibacillus]KQX44705.1 general stress protein [Paenibacillus sp. Root444D2]KRE33011.1 general stress protein [Paenibacillus sp. Soil724D2]
MRILVIAAHPNVEQSRVNKRWLAELRGYPDQITVQELYKAYPDYEINVENEQDLIARHDRIVFQFPIQWYSMPSLLKQWLDDVFTTSWLFGAGGKAVAGKELVLAMSIGGDESSYQSGGLIGYTISELIRPFQAFANQIGMTFLPHYKFYDAVKAKDDQIENSALLYVKHISSPDLSPMIVRKRMLDEMSKASSNPL